MPEPHEGIVQLSNDYNKAYSYLNSNGIKTMVTNSGTKFTAEAAVTHSGDHAGQEVIIFKQDNREYARSYECCWRCYHNCNRTRIGMYCKALDQKITVAG